MEFDSKSEGLRWLELSEEQKLGGIHSLKRQVKFDLIVNGHYIGKYTADFTYYRIRDDVYVVEEYKGYFRKGDRFRLKLFVALYGHMCEFIVTGEGAKSWKRRRNKMGITKT